MLPKPEISVQDEYLRADVIHGRWSLESYTNLWIQIANVCQETRKDRILAVFSEEMKGIPPAIEVHSLASTWRELGLPSSSKIALIDKNVATMPDFSFGAEIASRYGAEVETFDNESDAVLWLLQEPGSQLAQP